APGDRARIKVVRQKKHFAEAELLDLERPSPQRRTPPCPVFGRCGGCQWQHIPYADQVRWKGEIFTQILKRQAGVDPALVRTAVAAPQEWNYR
ncbi:MAG: RNA methyltransferase, partial [Desulfuromonadales bacterium]|nr:RNA methyltransferase [Desulfuromonadales bacterium]NIS43206.1 RNA methyltransferase [Desulfuromonadales bacterium]